MATETMQSYVRQVLTVVLVIGAAAAAGCGPGAAGSNSGPGSTKAGRMAFVMRQGSVNHIYLMQIGASGLGANPTRLSHDAEAENYPSWSPDGQHLAYQRDFNGSAIYVIKADGTGQRRLSPTPDSTLRRVGLPTDPRSSTCDCTPRLSRTSPL